MYTFVKLHNNSELCNEDANNSELNFKCNTSFETFPINVHVFIQIIISEILLRSKYSVRSINKSK